MSGRSSPVPVPCSSERFFDHFNPVYVAGIQGVNLKSTHEIIIDINLEMHSKQKADEGHYFIVVDGVPPHCQWQELKDYLRESAKVNPAGYADVVRVNEDGTRVGYCGLRSKSDAHKAFEFLLEEGWRGLSIRVTVAWKADLRSEEIERRRGPEASRRRRTAVSCTSSGLPVQQHNRYPSVTSPTIFSSDKFQSMRPSSAPSQVSAFSTSGVIEGLPVQNLQPQFQVPLASQHLTGKCFESVLHINSPKSAATDNAQFPYWSLSQGPLLPRSALAFERHDRIYTEQQSVHISRLPHEIKLAELRTLLLRFGQLEGIVIKRGKEKRCSATAKFTQAADATLAIQELNGKRINRFTLVVRPDRSEAGSLSSTASSVASHGSDNSDDSTGNMPSTSKSVRTGPLVVNGAYGPGYIKKRVKADDSESLTGSSDEGLSQKHSSSSANRATASRKPLLQPR